MVIKGIYTAASGMMLQLGKQDVLANNIANASTTSFKRQLAIATAHPDMQISRCEGSAAVGCQPIGKLGSGAVLGQVITDFTMGSLVQSGAPTDMALGEGHFFVVETPQGERFTRAGAFAINSEGLLCTSQGYPVLDIYDDYIYVESDFLVDERGDLYLEADYQTTLKLVSFENQDHLLEVGDNLYRNLDDDYIEAEDPQLMQGFLEKSNSNAVREMVTLLSAVRTYEMLQKMVQAQDELIQVAVDKVGATG